MMLGQPDSACTACSKAECRVAGDHATGFYNGISHPKTGTLGTGPPIGLIEGTCHPTGHDLEADHLGHSEGAGHPTDHDLKADSEGTGHPNDLDYDTVK